jgi:glutathione synthase/RimK-type ligase-like ATP-grasp enzyme
MLLVVTNKADLTSDYLVLRLRERSIPYTRLNTEDFTKAFSIELRADSRNSSAAIIDRDMSRRIDTKDVSGVYFRRPIPPVFQELQDRDQEFAVSESLEALRSLWRHIDESRWLNHPRRIQTSSNKYEQLSIARSLGFRIPRTLITDEPSAIREFYDACEGRVIIKAVKHGYVSDNGSARLAFTSELDESVMNKLDSYAHVPVAVQERVNKRYDVRVTVVGATVFSTAILSQQQEGTRLDWRRMDLLDMELAHTPIELPGTLADKCRMLTTHFGLSFSAVDLILDPDGDYVFLEMNPNGQWAWLEQRAGHPIRDAIIDFLLPAGQSLEGERAT